MQSEDEPLLAEERACGRDSTPPASAARAATGTADAATASICNEADAATPEEEEPPYSVRNEIVFFFSKGVRLRGGTAAAARHGSRATRADY